LIFEQKQEVIFQQSRSGYFIWFRYDNSPSNNSKPSPCCKSGRRYKSAVTGRLFNINRLHIIRPGKCNTQIQMEKNIRPLCVSVCNRYAVLFERKRVICRNLFF
jgi:hypothetical protein